MDGAVRAAGSVLLAVLLGAVVLVVAVGARPAVADEPGESTVAKELCARRSR